MDLELVYIQCPYCEKWSTTNGINELGMQYYEYMDSKRKNRNNIFQSPLYNFWGLSGLSEAPSFLMCKNCKKMFLQKDCKQTTDIVKTETEIKHYHESFLDIECTAEHTIIDFCVGSLSLGMSLPAKGFSEYIIKDCIELIEINGSANIHKKIYLRRILWHLINDLLRNSRNPVISYFRNYRNIFSKENIKESISIRKECVRLFKKYKKTKLESLKRLSELIEKAVDMQDCEYNYEYESQSINIEINKI